MTFPGVVPGFLFDEIQGRVPPGHVGARKMVVTPSNTTFRVIGSIGGGIAVFPARSRRRNLHARNFWHADVHIDDRGPARDDAKPGRDGPICGVAETLALTGHFSGRPNQGPRQRPQWPL